VSILLCRYSRTAPFSRGSPFFPLVPKVSAALWERMRGAKLRFGGRRVSMEGSFRGRCGRMGDGVSPGSTFPKRCANFGEDRDKGDKGTGHLSNARKSLMKSSRSFNETPDRYWHGAQ
jgi:hypothetical protein